MVTKFDIAAGKALPTLRTNSRSDGIMIPAWSRYCSDCGLTVLVSIRVEPKAKFKTACPSNKQAGLLNSTNSVNTYFMVKVLSALIRPYNKHVVTTSLGL
jgi:hypothetical protein